MPVVVDIEERQIAIAEATLRVAARAGIRGVTIRAVAEELGASTSVVTHYVPTRAQLLANAIERFSAWRKKELEASTRDVEGWKLVRVICRSVLATSEAEQVYDALWIELLAQPERQPEVEESLRRHGEWFRGVLRDAIASCGHPDPSQATDQIYLLLGGAAACGVADRETWNQERIDTTLDALLETELGTAILETAGAVS